MLWDPLAGVCQPRGLDSMVREGVRGKENGNLISGLAYMDLVG